MTALSADRNTPIRDGKVYSFPAAASAKIYKGALVVLDSSGNAKPGATATGLIAVGRAEEYVDNSAGLAAAVNVTVRAGVFKFANSDAIAKDSIGDTAYVVDDATVAKTGTGKSPAGIIVDVESGGVWVDIEPGNLLASTGLLAANNLSDIGTPATARTNLGLGSTDVPTFAGLLTSNLATKAAAYTVAFATDANGIIQDSTDNAVITLPDITAGSKGFTITVQNVAANGGALISVSPDATDKIKGSVGSVQFSGTANKDAQNTKATAKLGDFITLVSDGVDTWWVQGGQGVWASEA